VPKHKSFTLGELAKATNTEVVGNSDCHINNLSTIDNASEGSITFLTNQKYLHSLDNCMASAIVVSKEFKEDNRFNFLKSEDPYLTYAKLSKIFKYEEESLSPSIHESAVISELSSIGNNVHIGPNVFIGPNCSIKDNVFIHANCSIVKNVSISSNCLIHPGCVLGSDGFGFAPSQNGYVKIEQLGGLKIGKNVEIGANCSIDRGALDDTEIKDGVILDNLIHIAHNVILGEDSAIAASCAIAGSTKIGKNFRMGGLSGVLGHLEICDDVSVGAHTLITKDIQEPGDYVGIMPAQSHKNWAKSSVFIKKQGK
jgi:UDP-3-O-[3-hydroxymyristoyl] glucosamine N-acyltransferase|tara:strand:- start:6572 stop:7507 length:936 start_codon:yes stop_codon:yes gene_type:complete